MNNIESLVDQVKQTTYFQINKKNLRDRIQTELHIPYNNGMFLVTPELITFLSVWPGDTLYLEDIYQAPVQIANRKEFLDLCIERYQYAMNSWNDEYQKLRTIRKI